jgi:hypothetical protein
MNADRGRKTIFSSPFHFDEKFFFFRPKAKIIGRKTEIPVV